MDNVHDKLKIQVCMGSSCFSRGNKDSIKIIQDYIRDHQLKAQVELSGCLCEDQCKTGPNITIGNAFYSGVEPASVIDILNHHFKAVLS